MLSVRRGGGPTNDVAHRRKCVRTILGSLSRSRSVRKSIVPNSRSIAGGPQIFAPIARYAGNNLDEAPDVSVAGADCLTVQSSHQLRSYLLAIILKSEVAGCGTQGRQDKC